MKILALLLAAPFLGPLPGRASSEADTQAPVHAIASWYGETHRGKLMANGHPFDPNKLTAASWFFPLGTVVEIRLAGNASRTVTVKVTDRGPARELVRRGRLIDLSFAAFEALADPRTGLVSVVIRPVPAR